ncbi:MAG: hypothetical protein SGBAC_003147 [Bacillariaceae sp.]
MDHSEESNKDVVRTSQSEETKCAAAQSRSESFRIAGSTGIDLVQLRACCLAPNGLVSPERRKSGWPKLVGAHVEIWRAAAKIPPMDYDDAFDQTTDDTFFRLHHPSKDEIAYIKQVVASCKWESTGILKEDPIVLPEHQPTRRRSSQASSPMTAANGEFSKVERRVSFHLPELAFSTKRQKDRKTLRKVLIHLKRTNPNLAISSATCSAVAMVLSIVHSSSLSTLVIQQLVAYPWKFCLEWSNNEDPWELDDQWEILMKQLAPELDKNLLARIWDFQKELLAETDTNKIRSMVINLPSKLNSMEDIEAVVSRATKWMKDESSEDSSTDLQQIPAWVTATVAPADSAMVEYARHLRETVTEEGTALIPSGGARSNIMAENDWFSVEDPKSRFVSTLKARALKENEKEARTSSNKSSWILVLLILLLAAAVVLGLETDCSVILGAKRTITRSDNCLRQLSALYWEDSRLEAMGHHFKDEIQRVLLDLKILDAPDDPSTELDSGASSSHIHEEEVLDGSDADDDAVMSPSGNVGDENVGKELMEDAVSEAPRQLNTEHFARDQEALDESEPSVVPEEDAVVDQNEAEAPESMREDPGSSIVDSSMDDDNEDAVAEESDDPVEQSRRDAERLLKETLHQTEAASKLAESIVSQFLEEAKSIAGEKLVEDDAASETTKESSEVLQPDPSREEDNAIASAEGFVDFDHHFDLAVNDSKDEADTVPPELDESSSKQRIEAANGDVDQPSINRIEDQVDEERIEGGCETLGGTATENEATQDQSDSIHSPLQIEERLLGARIDDDHASDVNEREGTTNEVSGDIADDPSEDEAPMSEEPSMDRHTTAEYETMDKCSGDGVDEKSMETDHQAMKAMKAIGAENDDGATVLGLAQGLLSRYLGYVSYDDEPREIIQLSTPFFSKDDVSDVFEQLMMVSNNNMDPMQKWDQQSKARFSTWESTVLI